MMGMPSAQNAASAASTARVWYKPVKSGSSRSSSSSFERRGGGGGGAAPGFAEGALGEAVAARATTRRGGRSRPRRVRSAVRAPRERTRESQSG